MSTSICAICLDDPMTDKCFAIPCGHSYCFACLSRWFIESRSCPMCRKELTEITHNVVTFTFRSMSDGDLSRFNLYKDSWEVSDCLIKDFIVDTYRFRPSYLKCIESFIQRDLVMIKELLRVCGQQFSGSVKSVTNKVMNYIEMNMGIYVILFNDMLKPTLKQFSRRFILELINFLGKIRYQAEAV